MIFRLLPHIVGNPGCLYLLGHREREACRMCPQMLPKVKTGTCAPPTNETVVHLRSIDQLMMLYTFGT